MFAHSKVMFELYRAADGDRQYRAIYYTELDEHNRDAEIAQATRGEQWYAGFLREGDLSTAKQHIAELLERLNRGDAVTAADAAAALAPYEA